MYKIELKQKKIKSIIVSVASGVLQHSEDTHFI